MAHNHHPQQPYGAPDPYAYPPNNSLNTTPASEYPPYASTDRFNLNQGAFAGRDEAVTGGRINAYPPSGNNNSDEFAYEKGLNPVTRGSIAAQMAAEGQIPKKEGLRMWRSDEHKGAFTKGGRGRCCGRVCCCAIIVILLILVNIFAAFFLWVKPPSVSFNGIEAPSTGSEVSVQTDGFALNFRLNIGVINPNFFGATFSKITAKAFYPLKPSTSFGGGELTDAKIPKNSNSTVHFPFAVNYTKSYDSDGSVLKDIAGKCGFLDGTAASQLTVNYRIVLSVKIVAVTVSPSFSSSATFDCPLSQSDISGLLSSSDLSSLVGSSRSKRALIAPTYVDDLEREARLRRAHEQVMALVVERGFVELQEGRGKWVSTRD